MSTERARDSAVRADRATRTTKLALRPDEALARPLPIATLPALVRMASRRAVDALTIRRADIVQAAEHSPASLSPRPAIRDGFSDRRRLIGLDSDADPAAAWSVAVAPPLRRSAPRAARVSFTRVAPAPIRTGRVPWRGRPRRAAVRDVTTSEALRRQSPSQLLSAVSRPAAASTIDSSVAKTAKSGAEPAWPAAVKLTAGLEPVLPAASLWRALTL